MIDSFGVVCRILALMLLAGVFALLAWWGMHGPTVAVLGAMVFVLVSIFSTFERS